MGILTSPKASDPFHIERAMAETSGQRCAESAPARVRIMGRGGVAKLADARDLGSLGHKPWGFESLRRQTSPRELSLSEAARRAHDPARDGPCGRDLR